MRLTPLDIRKQEFRKAMRGLDSDEVYAFMNTVADEYEAVLNDNKALRERLLELDDKVQEYRNMEKTLRDTLLTAERVTVEAKDNARREADLIIKQAELEADKGVRSIKENAMQLRQEIQVLRRQRDSYMTRMKMLVESHLKFLESAAKDFDSEDSHLESEQSALTHTQALAEEAADKPRVEEIPVSRPSAAGRPSADVKPSATPPLPKDSPLGPTPAPPLSTPLSAPLPPGPAPQAPDTHAMHEDGAVSVAAEESGGSDLTELIDRVIEGQQETDPVPNAERPVSSDGDASPPRPVERAATDVLPAGETRASSRTDKETSERPTTPSEWSLDKLKRDILSKHSGGNETN